MKTRAIRIAIAALLFVLAIPIAQQTISSFSLGIGCLANPTSVTQPTTEWIEVVGLLTNEGVECQALRSDDQRLYTLHGDLRRFSTGDRVRVVGHEARVSYCQQGTTIEVHLIWRARQ